METKSRTQKKQEGKELLRSILSEVRNMKQEGKESS